MKTYNSTIRKGHDTDTDQRSAAQELNGMLPDTPFARAAYEWDNALLIAAEKMWGDRSMLWRKMN